MSVKSPHLPTTQGATAPTTLGVIIGNRDFFPDVLVGEARKDLTKLFDSIGVRAVMLTPGADEAARWRRKWHRASA